MKSESTSVESLVQKKRQALRFFVEQLLLSDVRDSIAKVILFGSLKRGEVEEDSDVDLFIVALNRLQQVAEICDEASLETTLRFDESVQPLIGCIDEFRKGDSYFFREVLKDREEIYAIAQDEVIRFLEGRFSEE